MSPARGARRLSVCFHNHLMPGADDGARDAEQARLALAALRGDGVTDVIASVHVEASLRERRSAWDRRIAEIDRAFARLDAIAAETPGVRVLRGAEVKLDTPHLDLADERLRLAGGPFVLVEFPALEVPVFGSGLIGRVREAGWRPILAHPERYRGADDVVGRGRDWTTAGAALQLNAGSLSRRYGTRAQAAASALLENGLISYVASDYHARDRTWLPEAADALGGMAGGVDALEVLEENGRRLLEGEPPLPVPPLRARGGLLTRLRRLLERTPTVDSA